MDHKTGDPQCNCTEETTAGKPWCPVHDNFAGRPAGLLGDEVPLPPEPLTLMPEPTENSALLKLLDLGYTISHPDKGVPFTVTACEANEDDAGGLILDAKKAAWIRGWLDSTERVPRRDGDFDAALKYFLGIPEGQEQEPVQHKWNCPSHPDNTPCHCGAKKSP